MTLFNRLPRGMELTESGRALLADARNIIALVDQAVDGVRQVSRGEAGRLTVGFTGSAAFHPFVPSVIRRFRDAAPNVRLVLEESSTGELTEAVAEGRVDAAASSVAPRAPAATWWWKACWRKPCWRPFPPTIRWSGAVPGSASRCRNWPRNPSSCTAATTALACTTPSSRPARPPASAPRMAQEAPRMLSTLSLVAAGLGVSLVPASLRRVNIEGVVYVNVTQPAGLRAPLNLIWRDAPCPAPAAS